MKGFGLAAADGLPGFMHGVMLATTLAVAAVCGHRSGTPYPVTPGTTIESTDPLDVAIARYRDVGDSADVEAYVVAHPDDERAIVWRELLALRAYDRAWTLGSEEHASDSYDPAPVANTHKLRSVVSHYPGTFAAHMAGAGLNSEAQVLEAGALRVLTRALPNPEAVAFVSGQDTWVDSIDPSHEDGMQMDIGLFRRRHADRVKTSLSAALLADGCKETLGYCRWYVDTFPDDPATQPMRKSIKAIWRARSHPPWKSKAHLQCAFDCSHRCRALPVTLDDACYDPCFAGC